MSEATVRIVLRLLAVLTVLLGAIVLGMTLVAWIATGISFDEGLLGVTARFNFVTLFSEAVIAGAGYVLYAVSPKLAQSIVREPSTTRRSSSTTRAARSHS